MKVFPDKKIWTCWWILIKTYLISLLPWPLVFLLTVVSAQFSDEYMLVGITLSSILYVFSVVFFVYIWTRMVYKLKYGAEG